MVVALHRLHDLAAELRQRAGPQAETPSVHRRAANQPAQNVAAELVRRRDPVGDEERRGARVLGHDANRDIGRRVVSVLLSGERLDLLDQGLEEVGAVRVARNALENLGEPLQSDPRVDVPPREWNERSVGLAVVLLEHVVPDLEPATAVLGRAAVVLGYVRLRTFVDEDLAVRPAESGRAGRPEVVFVAQPIDLVRRKQLQCLRPDVERLVIARMHCRHKLRAVESEHFREQLPAPLDRFFLPVVADREVAEHLEERLVIAVLADLVDVGRPENLLHRDDALGRRLLLSKEVRDERLHAGAREEDARVVLQDERPAGHAGVTLLLEEGDEPLANCRAVQFAVLLFLGR